MDNLKEEVPSYSCKMAKLLMKDLTECWSIKKVLLKHKLKYSTLISCYHLSKDWDWVENSCSQEIMVHINTEL